MTVRTITRTARCWLRYTLELCLYVPLDLLTVPIRNTLLPHRLKAAFPWLSCRRYLAFSLRAHCGPEEKYRHSRLFKIAVCTHYNSATGTCEHPKVRYK